MDILRRNFKGFRLLLWLGISLVLAFSTSNQVSAETLQIQSITLDTGSSNIILSKNESNLWAYSNSNSWGINGLIIRTNNPIPAGTDFTIGIRMYAYSRTALRNQWLENGIIKDYACSNNTYNEEGTLIGTRDVYCSYVLQIDTSSNVITFRPRFNFQTGGDFYVIPTINYVTGGDTVSAVNELKKQQQDNRESDIAKANDANADANSAVDAVSGAIKDKQSLLSIFYDITRIITITNPTNCQIPWYNMGSDSTSQIDLCAISTDLPIMGAIRTVSSIIALFIASRIGVGWYHRIIRELERISG